MLSNIKPKSSQAQKAKSCKALFQSLEWLDWTWATASVRASGGGKLTQQLKLSILNVHLRTGLPSQIIGAPRAPHRPLESPDYPFKLWLPFADKAVPHVTQPLSGAMITDSQSRSILNANHLKFFTSFAWIPLGSLSFIHICISPASILLANDSSSVLSYALFISSTAFLLDSTSHVQTCKTSRGSLESSITKVKGGEDTERIKLESAFVGGRKIVFKNLLLLVFIPW